MERPRCVTGGGAQVAELVTRSLPWCFSLPAPSSSSSSSRRHSRHSGSHSLSTITTYIKGDTPFPEFNFILMLDDISVLHFDSEKSVPDPRSLDDTVEETGVVNPNNIKTILAYMHADLEQRWLYATYGLNLTDNIHVQQRLVVCELIDNDQPGQMITKNALRGSTIDELRLHEGKFTYQSAIDVTEAKKKLQMDLILWRYEHLYYPTCTEILKGYLKQRSKQVKRKVKPRVRLIQKRRSVSGWDGVTCLATGFYPRHINLTILRDGQPVPDNLTTGGDLLPNGDGTYQMRKNLELSEEELKKHSYTYTVTHLSLDNKLDVHLDFDPGEPIRPILTFVVAALFLVTVMVVIIRIIYKKRQTGKGEFRAESVLQLL
ncbi:class I histocompatibility antigen, F10 alpha chain-like [Colossoma macropomum]|uniref:class I histocompatibility antigen, F10 alpha chain-like n=1 Tax=Colossoma macropomum TaxID=42526 RepID=UPI001863B0E9|nr:class I histocompatibility antigen, F10 alpha chain-like [Colossoma macropomum]